MYRISGNVLGYPAISGIRNPIMRQLSIFGSFDSEFQMLRASKMNVVCLVKVEDYKKLTCYSLFWFAFITITSN